MPKPPTTGSIDAATAASPESLRDADALAADCAAVAAQDPCFAPALPLVDHFPFQTRPPGFPTLVQIILEQQVSTKAAKSLWQRIVDYLGTPTPQTILAASPETLSACGFSRQKREYAWALATAVSDGLLDVDALTQADDATVRRTLMALPGFGPWSADCYLLFALNRRDILPAGDLALQVAYGHLAKLPGRPTADALNAALAPLSPRRTAASYLLWRAYLAWLAPGRRPA